MLQSFERSSDDFNVDDMILSHTSRLPSASQMEDKDRMAAIFGQLVFVLASSCVFSCD